MNLIIKPFQKAYGYPKIIEKNNKKYYIVGESKYNYLGYDIEEHKHKFMISECKNNKNPQDSNKPLTLMNFILNNNSKINTIYIKQQIKIRDKNITISDLNFYEEIKLTADCQNILK